MTSSPDQYRYASEPAATVVRALGGVRATAAAIGASRETCSQWNRPAERRGTGGYIPPRFWDVILVAAVKARAPEVTRELLESGKREKPDVGTMSRRKGALFERQVANDLKAMGFDARKVPLSGADANYPGDVEIVTPTGKWILQCKISAQGGGRHSIMRMLRQVVLGKVRAGGRDFMAMRRSQFGILLRGEPLAALNMPSIEIPGRQMLSHIEGHDALVFRRNGEREWLAVVPMERFTK